MQISSWCELFIGNFMLFNILNEDSSSSCEFIIFLFSNFFQPYFYLYSYHDIHINLSSSSSLFFHAFSPQNLPQQHFFLIRSFVIKMFSTFFLLSSQVNLQFLLRWCNRSMSWHWWEWKMIQQGAFGVFTNSLMMGFEVIGSY